MVRRRLVICPWVESSYDADGLIGYQYLPFRTTNPNAADYNDPQCGLGQWFARQKMDGPYRLAPIMLDVIAPYTWQADPWTISVRGVSASTCNHPGNGNVPTGANILYEDGHVTWRKFIYYPGNPEKNPTIGTLIDSAWVYYGKPGDLSKGPW